MLKNIWKGKNKDPKLAIVIPIGWRNELVLADQRVDAVTIGNMYKKRTPVNDIILNTVYYSVKDFREKIKMETIRQMNAG